MEYNSLWDNFSMGNGMNPREAGRLEYDGKLGKVLEEVGEAINFGCFRGSASSKFSSKIDSFFKPKKTICLVSLALNAPRIIRSVIDYKILKNGAGDSEEIVRKSIRLGLGIYKNWSYAADELEDFKSYIEGSENYKILEERVKQKEDCKTWVASRPEFSSASADKLQEMVGDGDLLFLALGHGGIGAGMDVYLRYCDKKDTSDSDFYPVRFSMEKKRDVVPQLTYIERDYLRELGEGRTVVVFDEDSYTGRTMKNAKKYFEDIFKFRVETLINYDDSV